MEFVQFWGDCSDGYCSITPRASNHGRAKRATHIDPTGAAVPQRPVDRTGLGVKKLGKRPGATLQPTTPAVGAPSRPARLLSGGLFFWTGAERGRDAVLAALLSFNSPEQYQVELIVASSSACGGGT